MGLFLILFNCLLCFPDFPVFISIFIFLNCHIFIEFAKQSLSFLVEIRVSKQFLQYLTVVKITVRTCLRRHLSILLLISFQRLPSLFKTWSFLFFLRQQRKGFDSVYSTFEFLAVKLRSNSAISFLHWLIN